VITRRKRATESSLAADDAERTPADRASGLGRQLLTGFLAGASTVIGLLLFMAVVLFLGGLAPLLYEITSGLRRQLSFWSTIGAGVAQSLASLPEFFWSARWAILGMGLLGTLLAFATHEARRIDRPWRGLISLVVTLGIVGMTVFGLQYANREVLLTWLAGQPYLLTLQNDFLLSNTASLLVGLLVALVASYAIWALWHWWYVRWSRWLGLEQAQAPTPEESAAPEESMLDYQMRMHRSKRGVPEPESEAAPAPSIAVTPTSRRLLFTLLAILAGTTLALLGALLLYNQFGSQLGSGDLFVSAQAPEATNTLNFNRTPRQVIVASINGQGAVDITLGSGQQSTPARQVDRLQLTEIGARPATATVDLTGLEPGSYWLKIALREGGGGQLRYAMLQGGGALAQVTSLLVGITAGLWLALDALVIFEFLTERGWLKARSALI
jgi:hypothetical protein